MKAKSCLLASALLLILLALSLSAQAASWELSYVASAQTRLTATIHPQVADGKTYLFLPSSADLSALCLSFATEGEPLTLTAGQASIAIESGQPFDLLSLFPGGAQDGVYPLILSGKTGEDRLSLLLMKSDNIGSLYLLSDDPKERGRAWMDSREHAAREPIPASMVMLGADGRCLYDGRLREIRGRGNTSWFWGTKKPYQIKLESPANLLGDPIPDNINRTWVLLAESFDATLLHNSVSLDLGQELGLVETPEYTSVDLYYDGEYCGFYLVAEKAQVKTGRLDIWDYGEMLEDHYGGKAALEALHPQKGENSYGNEYQYIPDIQVSLGAQGAYLLELDTIFGFQEKCWFTTSSDRRYVPQGPELLSRADMDYLSCFLQEIEDIAMSHGVHPETGKTLEDYLDIPSFVDVFLVQQFAKNVDFWKTSTFFYIPNGENKLYAGPLWDFDIAYAMRDTLRHEAGPDGYLPQDGWMCDLMLLPAFQEAVAARFETAFLPLITDILLGDENARGKSLLSLAGYLERINASQKMNYVLWELGGGYNNINKDTLFPTYEENIAYFQAFLQERADWMTQDIQKWGGHEISTVWVNLSYRNANIRQSASLTLASLYNNCTVSHLEWADEQSLEHPAETLYTASVTLTANEGSVFSAAPTLWVNGHPVAVIRSDSQTLCFDYSFLGPTFTPAMYEGVDYALLYQYDYFLEQNPEVAEEVGTDPEDVLDYYVYYGISDGLRGISTFDPEVFIANYEKLLNSYYMCDMEMSTLHYLENAYEEDLLGVEEDFVPPPANAPSPPSP